MFCWAAGVIVDLPWFERVERAERVFLWSI